MKDMLESPKVFQAYAVIDFCYWRLKELSKDVPKSAIVAAIDKATGYDIVATHQKLNEAMGLTMEIIRCKKIIQADYSYDEKFLKELAAVAESEG